MLVNTPHITYETLFEMIIIIVWEIIGRNAFWTFTDNHIIMTVNTEILTQKTSQADIEKNWYGKRNCDYEK